MNKGFEKILLSLKTDNSNFINEAPSAANSLLGGKSITIPKDGAHAGQSGWQSSEAWDIKANIGDPVYSLGDGTVITLSDYGPKVIKTNGKKLFGAGFTVKGENGAPDIYYTHLQNVQVKKGDKIKCGQLLGFVMDFPGSSYDHVHIGVKPPANIRDLIDSSGKIKCSSGRIIKSLMDISPSDLEGEEGEKIDTSLLKGIDFSKLASNSGMFQGLPIFDILNQLLSGIKESKQIESEIKKINYVLEQIDKSSDILKETTTIYESTIDDLGPNVKVSEKTAKLKINRRTNIYAPFAGSIQNSSTSSSCDGKLVLRFSKGGEKYFLEYCGFDTISVNDNQSVSSSKILGSATDDITISLYNTNKKLLSIKSFFEEESSETGKKEKKPEKEEKKFYDPVMASLRGLPFSIFGKPTSPTVKNQPDDKIAQFFKKNSPTSNSKVNENIEKIKKLLK